MWLTRGTTQGLYNIKSEASYVHGVSPAGTEWSDGDAVNHGSLSFTNWEAWVGTHGGPPGTVGVNACVHLIADDIYIDIVFDSWEAISGGAFSYHRAVSGATPAEKTTWGAIKALYR